MFKKYDFKSLTTTMDIEIIDPKESQKERNRYDDKRDLKSTIYKYYYYSDFFECEQLSARDMEFIKKGFSPITKDENGKETKLFTVHHIQPLNCGGKTLPSNLIPLPRKFHSFIHEKIIDPQIQGMQVGDRKTIIGVPDFSKITLDMMMDSSFRIQYHKFIVDEYRLLPIAVASKSKRDNGQFFGNWYKSHFGSIKE